MKELSISKEEFKLFNQDDQFGFFYDEDGFPRKDADEIFDEEVDKLYSKYAVIVVDYDDNIYGIKEGKKELIMEFVMEAYDIAREVKEE
ncbi:hypothetical protein [Plebeiibacterium marinum]|uniref:Uncharacterized protein n=1 Tax=Plebeiibacterium marinum TaxID=2992111 RepID=A0AAE3MEB3_9BACT|nr:hypothetical protein [Plebeiobacterium marinum]MCW3805876.1 hypothetical protein [Plebeiobacterium marinum]